jgi:hypothetical protein
MRRQLRGGMRSWAGSTVVAVAVASVAAAGPARAQAGAPGPVFPVEIEGREAGSSIVLSVQGNPVECGERCALTLAPGAYNLRVTDADGHLSSENLYVRMPVRATVTPANRAARITGIVLMGAAVVGAVVGGLGFLTAERIHSGRACGVSSTCDQETAPYLYMSAFGLGAAVVFGFTGFYLWDRNKTAGIELAPLGPR